MTQPAETPTGIPKRELTTTEKIQRLEKKADNLGNEYADLIPTFKEQMERFRMNEKALDAAQQDLADTEMQKAQLAQMASERGISPEAIQSRMADLEKSIEALQTRTERARKLKERVETDALVLLAKKAVLDAKKSELQGIFDSFLAEIEARINDETSHEQEQLAQLPDNEEFRTKTEQAKQAFIEAADKQPDNMKFPIYPGRPSRTIKAAQKKQEDLTHALDRNTRDHASQQKKLDSLTAKQEELAQEIETLQQKIEEKQQNKPTMAALSFMLELPAVKAWKQEIESLKSEKRGKESDVQDLKKDIHRAQEGLNTYKSIIDRMQNQLSTLGELTTLAQAWETASNEQMNNSSERNSLQNRIASCRRKYKNALSQTEFLFSNIKTKTDFLESL